MHTLSMNYTFDAEDRKVDVPWLPTSVVVYGAAVACSLAIVAALEVTGAGSAAEFLGSAIALAAP